MVVGTHIFHSFHSPFSVVRYLLHARHWAVALNELYKALLAPSLSYRTCDISLSLCGPDLCPGGCKGCERAGAVTC